MTGRSTKNHVVDEGDCIWKNQLYNCCHGSTSTLNELFHCIWHVRTCSDENRDTRMGKLLANRDSQNPSCKKQLSNPGVIICVTVKKTAFSGRLNSEFWDSTNRNRALLKETEGAARGWVSNFQKRPTKPKTNARNTAAPAMGSPGAHPHTRNTPVTHPTLVTHNTPRRLT